MTTNPEPLDILQDQKPKRDESGGFFTPGTVVLLVGIIAIVGVLGLQLYRQNQTQLGPGSRVPNFELTTFDGETIALQDLRGQVVVVNFWASWCPPCHDEAPDLQDFYEEYQAQGVVLLGINYLDEQPLPYMERYGITFPSGRDVGQRIAAVFNFDRPPETWVIDQNGTVAEFFLGAVTYDALQEAVVPLLEGDA